MHSVAKDIVAGKFESLGVDNSKTILCIVVTFGEIFSANLDWYYNNFFLKRANEKSNDSLKSMPNMLGRPIIISIETLELLITLLNNVNISLVDLYIEKENLNYHVVGDWDKFIGSKLKKIDNFEPLCFTKQQVNDFLDSMRFSIRNGVG